MLLLLALIAGSIAIGLVAGGSFRGFAEAEIRWFPLALAGLALQLIDIPGDEFAPEFMLLMLSFGLLLAFAWMNVGRPGFPLVLVGLVLNAVVIGANGGMPVSADALRASGQGDLVDELVTEGGEKHHLAGENERVLFLGDVIPVPPPFAQAVSIGDVIAYAGVGWFLISTLLGRRRDADRSEDDERTATRPARASAVRRSP